MKLGWWARVYLDGIRQNILYDFLSLGDAIDKAFAWKCFGLWAHAQSSALASTYKGTKRFLRYDCAFDT